MSLLVYVDRSSIHPGKAETLRHAIAELAVFVETNEPELVSYAAFFDADESHMTVVHVHRDAASLDRHLAVTGPRFATFASLVTLERIDIYGEPSTDALDRLEAKARLLGGASVTVHRSHLGFVR